MTHPTLATIRWAGAHIQGDLIKSWTAPHRRAPLFDPETLTKATVDVFGRKFTGELIPSFRNGQEQ